MTDKKYQVFVSSTFNDLRTEREKALMTILESDCIPVGMEYFPAIDEEQFKYIKRKIDESDYYVLILAAKYGTIDSKTGLSYTELEFDYAKETNVPIISIVHSDIGTIPAEHHESKVSSKKKLEKFYEKTKKGRIVKFWKTNEELTNALATSLPLVIRQFPRKGWARSNDIPNDELIHQNKKLESENNYLQHSLKTRSDFYTESTKKQVEEKERFEKYFVFYIKQNTIPANIKDYQEWFDGYKNKGGAINFDGPFALIQRMRVVNKDLYLPPLFGANAFHLIIKPEAFIHTLGESLGHNVIYDVKDFKLQGWSAADPIKP